MRITLNPPPVEYARAAIIAAYINMYGRKSGQEAKLAVLKPVVVAIETIW